MKVDEHFIFFFFSFFFFCTGFSPHDTYTSHITSHTQHTHSTANFFLFQVKTLMNRTYFIYFITPPSFFYFFMIDFYETFFYLLTYNFVFLSHIHFPIFQHITFHTTLYYIILQFYETNVFFGWFQGCSFKFSFSLYNFFLLYHFSISHSGSSTHSHSLSALIFAKLATICASCFFHIIFNQQFQKKSYKILMYNQQNQST